MRHLPRVFLAGLLFFSLAGVAQAVIPLPPPPPPVTPLTSPPPGWIVESRTTPGTYTWTVPSGVTQIQVGVVGAGGGGERGWWSNQDTPTSCGGDARRGGGGGSGGVIPGETIPVTPGQQFSFTVGAGGTGGYYSNPQQCADEDVQPPDVPGQSGGSSSFGSIIVSGGAPASATTGGAGGSPVGVFGGDGGNYCGGTGTGGSNGSGYGSGGDGYCGGSGSSGPGGTGQNGAVVISYPPLPQPTLTILADSVNISLGQSTGIHATYAAGAGDTMTGTAIKEVPNGGTEVSLYNGGPTSSHSYTFTPSTTGTYVFKPYITTAGYPSWDSYGQSVTVTVGAPVPTLTIKGNGQSGSVSVTAGTPVTIAATYAPGSGDTLQKTAINDYQSNLWCGTGNTCDPSMWTQSPLGSKSYTFTPTDPGSYIFYPAAQTTNYPSWNNWSQSLTVNVAAATCPGAHQVNPPTCSCDTGYTMSGGECIPIPPVCSGPHQVNPPTCSCDTLSGYTGPNGGPCTLVTTCSDPHAVAPLCTTCVSGYQMQGGVCTLIPPTLSLIAAQSSVRKGTPASLSWTVNNLLAGSGEQCGITSNPAGVFTATMPDGTAPSWSGTNVATGPINGTTIFTLSCTGSASVSVSVKLIATFIEQ